MHCPTNVDWKATKILLCYLKGTIQYGLFLVQSPSLDLHCFVDSDWAGCHDNQRLTSGYGVFLRKKLVYDLLKSNLQLAGHLLK